MSRGFFLFGELLRYFVFFFFLFQMENVENLDLRSVQIQIVAFNTNYDNYKTNMAMGRDI